MTEERKGSILEIAEHKNVFSIGWTDGKDNTVDYSSYIDWTNTSFGNLIDNVAQETAEAIMQAYPDDAEKHYMLCTTLFMETAYYLGIAPIHGTDEIEGEQEYHTLGNKISKLLEKKSMTQRELAEKAGVTEVSMSRYINGDRIPKAPVIVSIAKALNTSADYLLGMTDDVKR